MRVTESPTIRVDLDTFRLEETVEVRLVTLNIYRNGKRLTVVVDLHQSCMKNSPTITMGLCNESRSVVRTAQVRPWVRDDQHTDGYVYPFDHEIKGVVA